jgi:hypothetical protein
MFAGNPSAFRATIGRGADFWATAFCDFLRVFLRDLRSFAVEIKRLTRRREDREEHESENVEKKSSEFRKTRPKPSLVGPLYRG